MGITAALVGGLAAAGGQIGAAALSQPDPLKPRDSQLVDPQANPYQDPYLSAAGLQTLISLGIDPSIAYRNVGPLAATLNQLRLLPETQNSLRKSFVLLNGIVNQLRNDPTASPDLSGLDLKEKLRLDQILSQANISLDELVDLERKYQANYKSTIEPMRAAAQRQMQARINVQNQLAAQGSSALDLAGIRQNAETMMRDEINRVAGQRTQDVTRSANQGNYNPGRALGELERQRAQALQAVPTESLNSAAALLNLAANNAQYLTGLNAAPANQAQSLGSLTTRQDSASTIGAAQANAGSPFGAAVAGAGNTIANSLAAWSLQQQNQKNFDAELAAYQGIGKPNITSGGFNPGPVGP